VTFFVLNRLCDGVLLGLTHCGLASLKKQRICVQFYVKLGKSKMETA
jgi:hypothetical protein